jgi:hypothetical protein
LNLSGVGNRVLPSTGSAFAPPQRSWSNANFQQTPASTVASLVAVNSGQVWVLRTQ